MRMQQWRRRTSISSVLVILQVFLADGFLTPSVQSSNSLRPSSAYTTSPPQSSSTALSVWFFGGTDSEQTAIAGTEDESCELVPVRIERPSSNSRKIYGEIVAPVPLEDVWAILTDYDRLSVHVPNLVESKIVNRQSSGTPGDGSYRCRLFQRGAQKIIGFEFGASVTMDMQEMNAAAFSRALPKDIRGVGSTSEGKEQAISFKCTDSFFFSAFDGDWKVKERTGEDGLPETVLSYSVYVRPKGPVPVAALEWRIREDVPTNLRAVKKAAIEVGYEGVMASRGVRTTAKHNGAANGASSPPPPTPQPVKRLPAVVVNWDETETMAAYLKEG